MVEAYQEGTEIEWDWGSGTASGKVVEVFYDDVTRTLKGSEVKRKASRDDPAYLIEQADGDQVLKGHSEIRKAS
ncbi:MAG: DUF2945 domain-containing protein [Geminicoccaceae bacterium]